MPCLHTHQRGIHTFKTFHATRVLSSHFSTSSIVSSVHAAELHFPSDCSGMIQFLFQRDCDDLGIHHRMNALPSFIPPAAPSRLFRCRHEVQPRRARRVAFAIRSCATEPQESIAADSADSAHDEKADAPGAVLDRTWCTALNSLRSEQLYAFYTEIDSKYQPRLSNVFSLGRVNFGLELRESLQSVQRMFGFSLPEAYSPPSCLGFELSNAAIAARERAREERDGVPDAWPLVRLAYSSVCFVLDVAYGKRPIERFWVLETVARLPYQAYSSCLHLLSTLGWFRSPTLMNMHHAEDLNEAYHLAVMESLGGDQRWVVSGVKSLH